MIFFDRSQHFSNVQTRKLWHVCCYMLLTWFSLRDFLLKCWGNCVNSFYSCLSPLDDRISQTVVSFRPCVCALIQFAFSHLDWHMKASQTTTACCLPRSSFTRQQFTVTLPSLFFFSIVTATLLLLFCFVCFQNAAASILPVVVLLSICFLVFYPAKWGANEMVLCRLSFPFCFSLNVVGLPYFIHRLKPRGGGGGEEFDKKYNKLYEIVCRQLKVETLSRNPSCFVSPSIQNNLRSRPRNTLKTGPGTRQFAFTWRQTDLAVPLFCAWPANMVTTQL